MHLQVTPPSGADVYQGNTWQLPPNGRLSRPVSTGTPYARSEHTIEQVVLENPPPGSYVVTIVASELPEVPMNQLRFQSFALMVVGSGPEVRFCGSLLARIPVYEDPSAGQNVVLTGPVINRSAGDHADRTRGP